MNLATQIARLRGRGFSQEQAEIIVLMQEAAIVLFRAFPESFVLYGGANLIFFHNSARHSADLDLLSLSGEMPGAEEIGRTVAEGLAALSELLNAAPLQVRVLSSESAFRKVLVMKGDGRALFTVDLGRLGAILIRGVEEHSMESASSGTVVIVRSASRDLQLLQKAEAILARQIAKMRDAYDIRVLMDGGARLRGGLREHLEDLLRWQEMDEERILDRIGQVDAKHCEAELSTVLPRAEFQDLKSKNFQPLRDGLLALFADWL